MLWVGADWMLIGCDWMRIVGCWLALALRCCDRCVSSGPADHSEAGAELHTLLALFTTGPVGFSDAAGRTNATLLRRIAVTDGTLISPSRPMTSADRVYSAAWNKGHTTGYWDNGELLSTYSGTAETVDAIWAYVASSRVHLIKKTQKNPST